VYSPAGFAWMATIVMQSPIVALAARVLFQLLIGCKADRSNFNPKANHSSFVISVISAKNL
jgi:energy-converting hydrogenase Eha subunit A